MSVRRDRRGFALVVGLLVVLVLAALASTALATARAALRRATDEQTTLEAELGRDAVRAQFAAVAAERPVPSLLGSAQLFAAPDTMVTVVDLGEGWFRWTVAARSVTIVAELAHTRPWQGSCAAVVTAAEHLSSDVVYADPAVSCDSLVRHLPSSAVDSLVRTWEAAWVAGVVPETLTLSGAPGSAAVYRARQLIVLVPGTTVQGLVVAPRVEVGAGALVRGQVVARDAVVAAVGARLEASGLTAAAAWQASARIVLLGRRGLLAPP